MRNREVLRHGTTNFAWAVVTQVIRYLLNLLLLFIVPRELGVEQYAYWQLYLFYVGYIGFLQFGFNDGIYLRYGGFDTDELPRPLFRTYFWALLVSQALVSVILTGVLVVSVNDRSMAYAYVCAALAVTVIGTNAMFVMTYQITNRIKHYSMIVILDNVTMLAGIGAVLWLGIDSFRWVVAVHLGEKAAIFLVNIGVFRDLVLGERALLRQALPEVWANIAAGIKLMVANIMSLLLLGIGRFLVERFVGLVEFGLYSFAISMTNLALLFMASAGLVLYPLLCRLDQDSLPRLFERLNRLLVSIVLAMLLIYYPLRWIVLKWMAQYVPVLDYVFILFPMVVSQAKMQVVINNYYKSLRRERAMMWVNALSVLLFVFVAVPVFFAFRTVEVVVLSTLITLLFRCYISELYLRREMELGGGRRVMRELAMIIVFISAAGLLPPVWGAGVYLGALVAFLMVDRAKLVHDVQSIWGLYRVRTAVGNVAH